MEGTIICPICLGKGGICVGVKDDLTPILMPCYGCYGRGWVPLPHNEIHGECGFASHGRGQSGHSNIPITKMP